MAMQVSKDQIARTFNSASKFIAKHKQIVAETTKAVEAFGATFLLGLAEGRLAKDGSGRIHPLGVPSQLLLGGALLAGAVSGRLDEYGSHAGNMSAGLLGAYGDNLGREFGLTMRAKAKQPTQVALLPGAKAAELRAQVGGELQEVAVGGGGFGSFYGVPNDPFMSIGAAPGALSPEALQALINQSAAATPGQ